MLEREWVTISDPDDPHDRYLFDVSFLLSDYTCIYGAGCPGTAGDPVVACCGHGAHYVDESDRERVEAMVEVLGPGWMEGYADARRRGVTARVAGDVRTRVRDGGCIFLNRARFATGPGCSLHHYAIARGEHHMTYKPEVCWIVPLRRSVEETTADDGEPQFTTTITSYDRGAWGPGGADFDWWCTDAAEAHVGRRPVYESMERELRTMTTDKVYEELAGYLRARRRPRRTALPMVLRAAGTQ